MPIENSNFVVVAPLLIENPSAVLFSESFKNLKQNQGEIDENDKSKEDEIDESILISQFGSFLGLLIFAGGGVVDPVGEDQDGVPAQQDEGLVGVVDNLDDSGVHGSV